MIIETLKRHWWVPVIRGIAAIVFGIIAFAYPGLTIATLVLFFGAWVLIDGIFRIVARLGVALPIQNGASISSSELSGLSSDSSHSMHRR